MTREIRTVNLVPTPKFIPPWIGGGDRDFGGNGPRVNLFSQLEVRNGNELWANVWMRARETKSNWTEAEGSADYLVYRDQNVTNIYRILSDRSSSDNYTDTDHDDDIRQLSTEELVNHFVVTGDTRGDEAGLRTGVTAHFNPVTIEVEFNESPPTRTIQVEPTPEFIPQHVNGDKDFGGNGPRIDVSARLDVRNTRELWVTVSMRARETRSDWTEATGSASFIIYRNDRPIISILSDTFSADGYVDDDHDVDELIQTPNDLVNRFVITGDTRGDDAGARTGMTVHFNPIVIREG